MSEKTILLNEGIIKNELKKLVRSSVEETLNELWKRRRINSRMPPNVSAAKHAKATAAATTAETSGDVTLYVPKLKGVSIETAIIERYRRRESNVEEALIGMYLAGVSVRRVEDITEVLWGAKVSPAMISELNKMSTLKSGGTDIYRVADTHASMWTAACSLANRILTQAKSRC